MLGGWWLSGLFTSRRRRRPRRRRARRLLDQPAGADLARRLVAPAARSLPTPASASRSRACTTRGRRPAAHRVAAALRWRTVPIGTRTVFRGPRRRRWLVLMAAFAVSPRVTFGDRVVVDLDRAMGGAAGAVPLVRPIRVAADLPAADLDGRRRALRRVVRGAASVVLAAAVACRSPTSPTSMPTGGATGTRPGVLQLGEAVRVDRWPRIARALPPPGAGAATAVRGLGRCRSEPRSGSRPTIGSRVNTGTCRAARRAPAPATAARCGR